jgi:hypothetical protein
MTTVWVVSHVEDGLDATPSIIGVSASFEGARQIIMRDGKLSASEVEVRTLESNGESWWYAAAREGSYFTDEWEVSE